VLQQHAVGLAATYKKDKAEWQKAAADLRQPFWDWGRNAVPPDEIIFLQKLAIIKPNGAKAQVDNPFLRYIFRPVEPTFTGPYRAWQATVRHPATAAPDAPSDVPTLRA
jgi:tyrosinase